jgi:hypothetical protein
MPSPDRHRDAKGETQAHDLRGVVFYSDLKSILENISLARSQRRHRHRMTEYLCERCRSGPVQRMLRRRNEDDIVFEKRLCIHAGIFAHARGRADRQVDITSGQPLEDALWRTDGIERPRLRSNNRAPSASSSLAIRALSVGWLMPRLRAALRKRPVSQIAWMPEKSCVSIVLR